MTTELERELDHYRPFITAATQWRLACDLAEQAVTHCRCDQGIPSHAQTAYTASTFHIHCAPTDAGYRERLRDMQYLLCFLLADDQDQEKLQAFVGHFPQARAGRAGGDGELEANYAILARSLRDSGFDHGRFHAAFLRMCHAMTAEQSVDMTTVPRQRFLTLRRETIGVRPQLAYWDAQRVLRLGYQAQRLWMTSGITELVIDANWLCNDLFSVENDLAGQAAGGRPVSLNGVLIDARNSGDLAGAICSGEAEYNEKVRKIEQIIHHFTEVAADMNEPLLPFRARAAARIANGNLRSNQLLVPTRYPGAAGRATRAPHDRILGSPEPAEGSAATRGWVLTPQGPRCCRVSPRPGRPVMRSK